MSQVIKKLKGKTLSNNNYNNYNKKVLPKLKSNQKKTETETERVAVVNEMR